MILRREAVLLAGRAGLPDLAQEGLRDPSWVVRQAACAAAAEARVAAAVPDLVALLRAPDPDARVRAAAASALLALAPNDPSAVGALVGLLRGPDRVLADDVGERLTMLPRALVAEAIVREMSAELDATDASVDRARLFRILAEHRISGVVFLTGDLHYCLLQEHPPERTGTYAVPEVISSGIANSPTLGFALLDIDTTLPDPTLRVRIVLGDGSVPTDRTFASSTLQPA